MNVLIDLPNKENVRRVTQPLMPPERPLPRPIQKLNRPYRDSRAPEMKQGLGVTLWRLAIFLPAVVLTGALIATFADWFGSGGLRALEVILISLIALTFFWIALSVSTVVAGITLRLFSRVQQDRTTIAEGDPLRVALLVPAYNEVPWDVFGNAAAMVEELHCMDHSHQFDLFILSDTRDEAIAEQERRALAEVRSGLPGGTTIYYRRREENTDRKVGNLADWVERWGGDYDAMLVLDADSLMTGDAIVELTNELSCDPSAGLIQSFPKLFGAHSLFGRIQQFSSVVYGSLLAEGLAKWSDREGNYWGHNAIIRTEVFASCAGLPKIESGWGRRSKSKLILSHDFVEAGLIRRAGWSVRFLPHISGSYEETPATLIDYVIRDRRWCQGNLQHLNILASSGFHAVSRFHMFQGAMAYLLSPAWFVLLLFWALLGNGQENSVITYFNPENPLVPNWPEMDTPNNFLILLFMYGMLLAPKFLGVCSLWLTGVHPRQLGGVGQMILSFITEVSLSIAYAPVMMVQQTIAVVRTLLGVQESWQPQQRAGGRYTLGTLVKFHWLETCLGLLMTAGMIYGVVTLWLIPIGGSLLMAIPLSALSGVNLRDRVWGRMQMSTPEENDEPDVMRMARMKRLWLRSILEPSPVSKIAAE
ncbi:glucans biosynthesis glucosyltransferase MdoH [Amaricoccus tamworthensis]|uniref:glucans biosynthesis glucosyltransferase MdoH n=1 Tax=Amaricoccus tamworthensis TaxID=57002 RepID=UPI003C7E204C